MGGGAEDVTTTQEPWSGAKPHILEFLRRSREFADEPQRMYPGDMTVDPGQLTGMSLERAREFMKTDSGGALRAFAGEAMGGFASNPMLDQTFDAASRGITRNFQRVTQPGIESAFARAGRGVSSASGRAVGVAQNELAGSLGDLASQFYYSDYERRMGDRFRGASLLGEADRLDTAQIGVLGAAGAQEDAYAQQRLNELIQRFEFGQMEPEQRLDRFGQRVGAGGGTGFGSTTGPGAANNTGATVGLGVASVLSSILSAIPYTAPIGAAMSVGTGVAGGVMQASQRPVIGHRPGGMLY